MHEKVQRAIQKVDRHVVYHSLSLKGDGPPQTFPSTARVKDQYPPFVKAYGEPVLLQASTWAATLVSMKESGLQEGEEPDIYTHPWTFWRTSQKGHHTLV